MLELAQLIDDEKLASTLEDAYQRDVKLLGLDIEERETILSSLEDPPPGLEELRAVLLQEQTWRKREGIS